MLFYLFFINNIDACIYDTNHNINFKKVIFFSIKQPKLLHHIKQEICVVEKRLLPNNINNIVFKNNLFDQISIIQHHNLIFIKVLQKNKLMNIKFIGNKLIKTQLLLQLINNINIQKGNILDRSKLYIIKNIIEQIYHINGLLNCIVKIKTIIHNNEVSLFIYINEGNIFKIKNVDIIGNHYFSKKIILSNTGLSKNWINNFFIKKNYSTPFLMYVLNNIKKMYLDAGFLQFNIQNISQSILYDKNQICITININENQQFLIKNIDIYINNKKYLINIKQIFNSYINNIYQYKQDMLLKKNILIFLQSHGFIHPIIKIYKQNNYINNNIKLYVYIKTGIQYHIKHIIFTGNHSIPFKVLKKLISQKEGQILNLTCINKTIDKLKKLEYIDNVSLFIHDNHDSLHTVNIIYNINYKNKGLFNINFGINNYKLVLNTYLEQDNFLKTYNHIITNIIKDSTHSYLEFNLHRPYIFNTRISTGINLFFNNPIINKIYLKNIDYIDQIKGIFTYIIIPIKDSIIIKNKLGFIQHKIYNFSSQFSVFDYFTHVKGYKLPLKHNNYYLNEFNIQHILTFNTVSNYVSIKKGILSILNINIGIPLKNYYNSNYQIILDYNHYIPIYIKISHHHHNIYSSLLNLVINSTIGYSNSIHNNIYPFYKNFKNQSNIVRGFNPNTFEPNGIYINSIKQPCNKHQIICFNQQHTIGGNLIIKLTTELILPIYNIKIGNYIQKVKPSIFLDIGNIWNIINTNNYLSKLYSLSNSNILTKLKASIGLSLKWKTPLGIIILSYAHPFNKSIHDAFEPIQFNIGNNW
ncbi:outer membrane protein assembly factor BamA [Enterobacteriaceae endosymbiont of Neohaemonia nigricornis]|uniref:outer membrane protein assembly factor BamA n=1 Tax=Enterobacteriaceae endosymbiont of Neohaemonia nigricornis TaxID=2675792 RepID=UPI001ABFD998|nr:outer membrane protein assembly factor BamA [Enterobacteriaceae endosymbiont of Neohaemonia nigricornis]